MFHWLKSRFIQWLERELYTVKVEFVPQNNFYCLPCKSTYGSAGYDVYSTKKFTLKPNEKIRIPIGFITGFDGTKWVWMFYTKSGLAWNFDLEKTVSVIDGDYRQQAHVILKNKGTKSYHCNCGEKIGQGIFHRVGIINWIQKEKVSDLPKSNRNGGFGSTGTR